MSLKVPLDCLVVLPGKSYSAQTIVIMLSRLRLRRHVRRSQVLRSTPSRLRALELELGLEL